MNKKLKIMKTKFIIAINSIVFFFGINSYSQILSGSFDPDINIQLPCDTIGENYYLFDLNNDNTMDFKLACRSFYTQKTSYKQFYNYGAAIDSIGNSRVNTGPYFYGDTIAENIYFRKSGYLYGLFPESLGLIGSWYLTVPDTDTFAFVGLKILVNGQSHYGWLKIRTDGKEITLDSYAWNQIPGQYIIAGQIQ
jgi:hypothetical protein